MKKNESLNLIPILKDHIGEVIYSIIEGNVIIKSIDENNNTIIAGNFIYNTDGTLYVTETKNECLIFPSANNRIWDIDKNTQYPTTWEGCLNKFKQCEYIDSRSEISRYNVHERLDHDVDKNSLPINYGKAILALCMLTIIREVYRDGWEPDWTNPNQVKYAIIYDRNEIITPFVAYTQQFLTFQSKEIRDKFLKNFRQLIEEAKEYI